jgi:hypothetical protein
LKTLVMLVVLTAWLAVVCVSLLYGKIPDAAVLGIPAAVVLALAPPIPALRNRRRRSPPADETADGEDAT